MSYVSVSGLILKGDGRRTVTAAGTAVQLTSTDTPCRLITFQAERDNTGYVAIGASTVVAAQGSERGINLAAGDAVDIYVNNLTQVYVDSTVNGDGVAYVYYDG
jgi:hypothetical protein